jgi:GT2 family glycosyltransferase
VTTPRVVVIIPNWNGSHLLPTCLASLRRQTFRDFQTWVMDNGSSDGSLELIARDFPEVVGVAMPFNGFFAGAVNEGIRRTESELVVLLNNDTEADERWLEALVAGLDAAPWADSAASKLRLFDRRDVIHSAGDGFGRNGLAYNRGVWQQDDGRWDARAELFSACGGAALYRRSLFDDVGLFDEGFVAYCEDVDLAFRAQLRGHRCVFVPEAIVYHRLSATGGGPFASYHVGRNTISVLVKDVPAPFWRRDGHRFVAAQLGIAAHSLRHAREPAARARLRGQWDAVRNLPALLRERRAVQAAATAPLDRVAGLLGD